MEMVTKRCVDEWLIEPDIEGAREYARLSIIAEPALSRGNNSFPPVSLTP
jgi:hypothetical protein